jgi:hypothetical protein
MARFICATGWTTEATAALLGHAAKPASPGQPNTGVQRTALYADEIDAILKAGFGSKALPVYWCGAGEAQAVRRFLGKLGR